ncbi:hypothetical protein N9E78_00195 [bacterium]|nr:hypothetical protein [bacterium]
MTAGIQFKGPRFSRSIGELDINNIKNAEHRDDVSNRWEKFLDWFCQTNKEEAKTLLFDMLKSDDPSRKIECFNQLKNIVSPAYTGHFTHEINELEDKSFTVTLSISGVLDPITLKTPGVMVDVTNSDVIKSSLNEAIKEGQSDLTQMKKDIGRLTYEGDFEFDECKNVTPDSLDSFTSAMPDRQKKVLDVVATQTGILAIKNGVFDIGDGMVFLGNPESLVISISKKDDASIEVGFNMIQHMQSERFEILLTSNNLTREQGRYPSLIMEGKLAIDAKGQHSLVELKLYHPGIN